MTPYRKLWSVALLLLTLVLATTSLWAAPPSDSEAALRAQAKGEVVVQRDAATGRATFIHAQDGALTSEFASLNGSAEAKARAFLSGYGDLFGVRDQATLHMTSEKTDALGMTHVRFEQRHGGIPVLGAEIVVHMDKSGAVRAANGSVVPEAEKLNTQVMLKQEEAGKIAAQQLAFTKDAFIGESSLVIVTPGLFTGQGSDSYLTYRMKVDSVSRPELAKWVFVDAQTGDLRFSVPAVYDGRNRSTYNMKARTQYNRAVLARSEGQAPVTSATSCTAADVNNAHDYAGNTYDFFYTRFGRDSYNNAGAALRSYVCYGSNYQNAFWDGSRMTYGKGFAVDDVVAHELSHAVTEYASGLVYSYQSGALNESFSDIFGEAVDLTNTGGNDSSSVRWDMGEDIPGIGAIRDMMDPTRFGDPDKVSSPYYYCGTGDNGGVHYNSGVPNKAFALMVDGGNFNGYSVSAIGLDAAVQVQYRVNEVYLTSSSNFVTNYNALNTACADLYGASSATCASVKAAADAVEMTRTPCQ